MTILYGSSQKKEVNWNFHPGRYRCDKLIGGVRCNQGGFCKQTILNSETFYNF